MEKQYLTGYFGGKITHLKEILPFIPSHHLYCDVFGGMMPILLNKPKSKIEIYNDINGRLVNLWKQIQADYRYLQLSCETAICSRQLWIDSLQQSNNPQEDAYQFLYSIVRSFSSMGSEFIGFGDERVRKDFIEVGNRIKLLHKRIQKIIIEQLSFEDIIRRVEKYNSNSKFYYIDPPYYQGGDKYEQMSGNESNWTINNMNCLIDLLDKSNCRFMISIDKDITNQFTRKDIIVHSYLKKQKAGTNNKQQNDRKEYLIMNYKTGLNRYV
jgi:DNA adenine methylase